MDIEVLIITPETKDYLDWTRRVQKEAPNLIKDAITMDYIARKLKQPDILLFVCIETNEMQKIRGFSIIVSNGFSYHLSVLCANHCGSVIVKRIQEEARMTEDIQHIFLMCQESLVSYYTKFGFKVTCVDEPIVMMWYVKENKNIDIAFKRGAIIT